MKRIDGHLFLLWFSRGALFFDYYYFGFLKIIGLSPAAGLVEALFERTIPFIPFETFFILFGVLEVLIGIGFLIPRLTKYVVPVMLIHMFTTLLPLIMVPELSWAGPLQPTLAGQYMFKNFVLIALALWIYTEKRLKSKSQLRK